MTVTNEEKELKMRRLGMEASYLAACALADRIPQPDETVDPDMLYKFCKFHSITSIVAMALERYWQEHPAPSEVMDKWRKARDKAIRKNILLNAERERILGHLESIGCWYLPLKGSLLQYDYPQFGMRQMNDNDILYDEGKTEEVHDFMLANGYETVTYLKGNHDEYVKKPVYNMEMHRSLFMGAVNPEMATYYRNVENRMCKDEGNQFGYHFSREDFYIFLVAHAYKHYLHGGIGIRNLLDVYVYTEKYRDCLDWAYLEKEIRSFGAWEFDEECRRLSRKLLSPEGRSYDFTEADIRALDIYFTSGAFGTSDRVVANKLESAAGNGGSGGKLRYLLRRMFPPVEYLAENAPILRKKPWLAPLFYLKRFFSVLFARRKFIAEELRILLKLKK